MTVPQILPCRMAYGKKLILRPEVMMVVIVLLILHLIEEEK